MQQIYRRTPMLKCDYHKVAKRVVLIVSEKLEHFSFKSLYFQKQAPGYSIKKGFLKISQNVKENTSAIVPFLIKLQLIHFIKKETLAQVFSCESCEIFKNTIFKEHLWTTASSFLILTRLRKYKEGQ